MRSPRLLFSVLATALPVAAVTPGSLTELDRITVTATRLEQEIFSVPYTAHVIDHRDFLERRAVRTLPDALLETPGVMVQRTSYGQGSPFLRGFTGFRTLLLIDGIRVNNAVFRDGPNQYWSTIDPFGIDRLDIVMGPGSVLHGSDAIGGTLNAITTGPLLDLSASPAGRSSRGSLQYRFASAENSHVGRVAFSAALAPQVGVSAGMTWKNFDDLHGASDRGVQPGTGYRERGADVKVQARPRPNLTLTAAYQRFEQDDVPRTHATVDGLSFAGTALGTDLSRRLDQDRELVYVQMALRPKSEWISQANVSLSRHGQREEQNRVRSNGRRDVAGFTDDQYGLLVQLESAGRFGTFSYGLEYYYDQVDSHGADIAANGVVRLLPRGNVADDARHRLLGLYVQDQFRLTPRLALTTGVRFSRAEASSAKVDPDPADQMIFPALDRRNQATTGSLRAQYDVVPRWNLFAGASQGFRAPNLSDFTSFELARSGERETPAPNLRPEKFLSFEVGTKARIHKISTELYAAAFRTEIRDQIVRFPTGQLVFGDREVTRANVGQGFTQGMEIGGTTSMPGGVSVFGNLTWLEGEIDGYFGSVPVREPASRIQPLTIGGGARWTSPRDRWWLEASGRYARRQDKLSSGDIADTQRIPPGGTPGYSMYSLRAGWRAREWLTTTAALENIFDRDYRIHGSGLNEPGFNAVFSTKIGW